MTFSENQNACSPMGLKLVKGARHDCEVVPFSDSIHNGLKVTSLRDPYTLDEANEVAILHTFLTSGDFISTKTQRNQHENYSKEHTTL